MFQFFSCRRLPHERCDFAVSGSVRREGRQKIPCISFNIITLLSSSFKVFFRMAHAVCDAVWRKIMCLESVLSSVSDIRVEGWVWLFFVGFVCVSKIYIHKASTLGKMCVWSATKLAYKAGQILFSEALHAFKSWWVGNHWNLSVAKIISAAFNWPRHTHHH